MRRDIELLCKNLPVSGGLIQHIDIVAVFKDVLDLTAGEQVFDVLRDTGGNAAPFAETLPDFHGVRGGLFFFQQKVHFVDIVAGGLVSFAVDRHAVPYLILHDEHTDLLKLFAKLLDVVAHHTAVNIHIGAVVEDVQAAGNIDFKSGGDMTKAPTDVEDLWRFIDEIPYWTAKKHGKKYRLMYQVYAHPKYIEYGKKFFAGVDERYTEYAKSLEPKLGIPYQKLTPLIFILIRACVHFALFEDEYYLKSQIEVLKQAANLFADKYSSDYPNGGTTK